MLAFFVFVSWILLILESCRSSQGRGRGGGGFALATPFPGIRPWCTPLQVTKKFRNDDVNGFAITATSTKLSKNRRACPRRMKAVIISWLRAYQAWKAHAMEIHNLCKRQCLCWSCSSCWTDVVQARRRLKGISDTETDTHHESNAQAAENCSRKNRTCLRMTGELSLDPEQQNNNNNN